MVARPTVGDCGLLLESIAIMAMVCGMIVASEIMTALGGYRQVASDLQLPPSVVHKWSRRGFPARYWGEIVALADARGVPWITLDALKRPMWRREAKLAPAEMESAT